MAGCAGEPAAAASDVVATRCFVKTPRGAIVRAAGALASPVVAELPFRTAVTAVRVAGTRVEITDPVRGWLSMKNIDLYPKDAPEPAVDGPTEALAARDSDGGGGRAADGGAVDEPCLTPEEDDVPAAARPEVVASDAFAGYHEGYFFGTKDGVTAYHRDGAADGRTTIEDGRTTIELFCDDGARGRPYKVVGLLGARIRQTREVFSPVVGIVDQGRHVRILETARIVVADQPTPGDPWAKAAHKGLDKVVTRGRVAAPLRGWLTLSATLVEAVDVDVDKTKMLACVQRLDKCTETSRQGREALSALAAVVTRSPRLVGCAEVAPYLKQLREKIDEDARHRRDKLDDSDDSMDDSTDDEEPRNIQRFIQGTQWVSATTNAAMAHNAALKKQRRAAVEPPAGVPSDDVVSTAAAVIVRDVSLARCAKPRDPTRVPFFDAPRAGGRDAARSEAIELMRWAMQKMTLRHDMYIATEPGSRAPAILAELFFLLGREVEWVNVTRDTAESDLRQRREIVQGDVLWVDQPPVRAALQGRVLVLDGLEHAERNVLPMLNNLMENREMELDDGSLIVSPERFDALEADQAATARGAEPRRRLRRASEAFIVIVLGTRGQILDPPLRSRLSAYDLSGPPATHREDAAGPASEDETVETLVLQLSVAVAAIQGPPVCVPSVVESIFKLNALFQGIAFRDALARAYPYQLMCAGPKIRLVDQLVDSLCGGSTNLCGGPTGVEHHFAAGPDHRSSLVEAPTYDFVSASWPAGSSPGLELTFGPPEGAVAVEASCGQEVPHEHYADADLTAKQRATLSRMLHDHCAGHDVCVVGDRGAGKTRVVRAFASALRYSVRTTLCHADLTARELLQRHVTDEAGNTIWCDSALVDAAVKGELAVLDGIDRLAPALLSSTLARLVLRRELDLPDGSRLLSAQHCDRLAADLGTTVEKLEARYRVRRVHPAFRIIAVATVAQQGDHATWLDASLTPLFRFEALQPFASADDRSVVLRACGAAACAATVADALVGFNASLRDHVSTCRAATGADAAAAAVARCVLSPRQLVRVATAAAASGDFEGALDRVIGVHTHFLEPASAREVVRRLADVACRRTKDRRSKFALRAGQRAPTPRYDDADLIVGDVRIPTRSEAHLRSRSAGGATVVPAERRVASSRDFVGIEAHKWYVRDALLELSLGRHVLFVGNQGVGKNKVADHIVHLLGADREYVQLHRDTTIGTLTWAPLVQQGVLTATDSTLVRALKKGSLLLVDEADKAPPEVVCVLKALLEDGDLTLADGRRVLRCSKCEGRRRRDASAEPCERCSETRDVVIHPGFRMIVLANRAGAPFDGHDLHAVCGDAFSTVVFDDVDCVSEIQLLRAHAPDVDDQILRKLSLAFSHLRTLATAPQHGARTRLTYPYSSRELVKVVRHLQRFPQDGVAFALRNVFALDASSAPLALALRDELNRKDLPGDAVFADEDGGADVSVEGNVVSFKQRGAQTIAVKAKRPGQSNATPALLGSPLRAWGAAVPKRRAAALRWMLLKRQLHQDMCLVGDEGSPEPRRLALEFCALIGREAEVIILSRDTTEADLRQRRELIGGTLVWHDAAPVRAAVHGRVLIVEGMHRCERNVLPLLNDLLENREMPLEDGGGLVSDQRFDALVDGGLLGADSKVRRVSPQFLVIAIGVAIPKHAGRAMDPPLRSRFCFYALPPPSIDELEAAVDATFRASAATACLPDCGDAEASALRVARFVHNLRRAWEPTRPRGLFALDGTARELPQWGKDQLLRQATVAARPWPPHGAVSASARLLAAFERLAPLDALRRSFPFDLLRGVRGDAVAEAELNDLLRAHGIAGDAAIEDACAVAFAKTPTLREEEALAHGSTLVSSVDDARPEEEEAGARGSGSASSDAPAPNEDSGRGSDSDSVSSEDSTDSEDEDIDADGRPIDRSGVMQQGLDAPRGSDEESDSDEDDDSFDADGMPLGATPTTPTTPRQLGAATYTIEAVHLAPDAADGSRRRSVVFRSGDGDADVSALCASGDARPAPLRGRPALSGTQRCVLARMVQDHCVGRDVCVVGGKGVGKTTLVREFAELLGYTTCTVTCHGDMTVRDLLARRVSSGGGTAWAHSALVDAALAGGLAVLDGIDRLPPGVLAAALGRLFSDRDLDLPDGTRLAARLDAADARPALRVHSAFRILATANPPNASNPWLDGDVLGLMHYEVVRQLSSTEVVSLVKMSFLDAAGEKTFRLAAHEERSLIKYAEAMRQCGLTERSLAPMALTPRTLRRIADHMRLWKRGLGSGVENVFAAHQDFLPGPKRRIARRILRDALGDRGMKRMRRDALERDGETPAVSVNRTLVGEEPIDGDYGTWDHSVRIGDVEHVRRVSERPDAELVPRGYFVDVASHLRLLRGMLADWGNGDHLLLVGNQGVGKNKVLDRFLELLQRERHYIQLHRDTTIESLTVSRTLHRGDVVWQDAPLVKAALRGHVLVIDEADKAPREVVCVLKALVDDGDLALADGRRLVSARHGATAPAGSLVMHADFRIVVLANRPGFPFAGNDFYAACGDVFACSAVRNVDECSEADMARGAAPGLPARTAARLAKVFKNLRGLHDAARVAYPFSSRELVKVCEHLEAFPHDGVEAAFKDVFAFEAHDAHLLETLRNVLRQTPADVDASPQTSSNTTSGTNAKATAVERRGAAVGRSVPATGSAPTGRGAFADVVEDARRLEMHQERMTAAERAHYDRLLEPVAHDVAALRAVLAGSSARATERTWRRLQPHGELDDAMLVDGLAGATNVYKRRVSPADGARGPPGALTRAPTRVRFVVDISGSMYACNKLDRRLTRLLHCVVLVFEAFAGFEDRFDYSIVGHSGASACVPLVDWGKPPRGRAERLELLTTMTDHARKCRSGDHTLEATQRAIADAAAGNADERFVFVLSDADFAAYDVSAEALGNALSANASVRAYALFVSPGAAPEAVAAKLPAGLGFHCHDAAHLVTAFKELFQANLAQTH